MAEVLLRQSSAVGVTSRTHIHEQSARQQAGRLRAQYESHEFDAPASMGAYASIKTIIIHTDPWPGAGCSCQRGAFTLLERAQKLIVRNRGMGGVTIRLNAASGVDLITVSDFEQWDVDAVELTDVFILNTGSVAVPLRIILV